MNSSEIESFLAILQHRNLTEAAKSLFISQSTLSQRLFELEKKVGMTLIERGRGGKRPVLTQAGKQFLLIAHRWENLVQETKQLQEQVNDLSLSIGSVDSLHISIFPPLYKSLMAHRPKISLNLRTYNSAELYLEVDRGELDMGFTLLNLPMRNIIVEEIYSEPRVVLVKEDEKSDIKQGGFIELKDLDQDKEIFFIGDYAYNKWYQGWKKGKTYPALQVDTIQLLLLLLDKKDSWCLMPLCMAKFLMRLGHYSCYKLNEMPVVRTCYKIHSKNLAPSKAKSIEIVNKYLSEIKLFSQHNT